ncbi:MAG: ribbon-helix-helix protein, CopG family [Candidatus Hydrogenedentota bacterium]
MKVVSIEISEVLSLRLEQAAQERGQSEAALMREALERYLGEEKAPAEGSFLQAAGDLVGCVEGPGDLSTNPKHMEGFGE